MKQYRVSYYQGGLTRTQKYFANIHDAIRFTVYEIRQPHDLFSIDLIED